MSMKLHWSPRSPFVRKVMIVLHETGLLDQVACTRSPVAMAAPPNKEVLTDNPLAKIPTLVLEDGRALFDSRVICEYLAQLTDKISLLPAAGAERFVHLLWQALGDGLTDILLLWRTEFLRGEKASPEILSGFAVKVRACLAVLESEVTELANKDFGLGHIAIICALGQLDFRFAGCGWRDVHPKLAAWLQEQQERPSVRLTAVEDDAPSASGSSPDSAPIFIV